MIELAPKHVDAHVRLAKLLLVNGDLERALSLANSADALKPSDADILALSGAILVRLNDIDGARAKAQTALALDAGNADAIAVIATDRMMAGQLRDALSQIETGIGRNPDNLGLLLFRLRILEQLGETRQFEAAVRHLSETYPAERAFQRMLVRFLMVQGRTDDAESELRKLAPEILSNTDHVLDIVRFLAQVRGVEAAQQELDSAVRSSPNSTTLKLALAELQISRREFDRATALLREIAQAEPTASLALKAKVLLAQVLALQSNFQEARKLIAEVIAADAGNADALALRAALHIEDGALDNAVADLRLALQQKPNSAPLMQSLAQALERKR